MPHEVPVHPGQGWDRRTHPFRHIEQFSFAQKEQGILAPSRRFVRDLKLFKDWTRGVAMVIAAQGESSEVTVPSAAGDQNIDLAA